MSEESGGKKGPFTADVGGLENLTREKLVSELFSANKDNIARKTRTQKPFAASALQLLAFHLSHIKNKLDMVPQGTILHEITVNGKTRKVANAGDTLRAFIWFFDNRNISLEGLARAEYITALQGVQETESADIKKQRQLESIIGI